MNGLRKLLKWFLLPWWIFLLPRRRGLRPYFGPPVQALGGPGLKLHTLKAHFGNSWWPSSIYVVSGKPLPLSFLKLARRKKIPVILNQNGVFYPAWYSGSVDTSNTFLRRIHEVSNHVLYQSQFCKRSCETWVNPPTRPSGILYNSVDTQRFRPSSKVPPRLTLLASSYFADHNRYLLECLINFSTILNEKRHDVDLLIAGKIASPLDRTFQSALHKAKVRRLGAFSVNEAPKVYQKASIFIHLSHMDACPSTVLEAMASGLPVIYSQTGGTPELVGDAGIGLPVEENYEVRQVPTIDTVLEVISFLERNLQEYRERARQRAVRYFSTESWLKTHDRLFHEVLNN